MISCEVVLCKGHGCMGLWGGKMDELTFAEYEERN